MMHSELVEKRKWIGDAHFLHALNFCMLLPGPEAQQLAIYIGWLLHKIRGGIAAGALFVIPSIFILWALSYVYVAYGNIPWIAAVFYGLKPAVLAIVAAAVIRIGSKALKNFVMWTIAAAAFVAIYFFHVPFPVIIVTAGMIGLIGGKILPRYFFGENVQPADVDPGSAAPDWAKPSLLRALKISAIWIVVWALPLSLVGIFLGTQHTVFREGIFSAKPPSSPSAAPTPCCPTSRNKRSNIITGSPRPNGRWARSGRDDARPAHHGAAIRRVSRRLESSGKSPPLLAATLGALITTWTTFVPCFLWIFLGAPYIEKLRGNRQLTSALSTVTAAVVGVILNLAVWFGLHVIFPASGKIDWFAVIVCAVAFAGMLRWKWDIVPVVLGSGLLGLAYKFILAW